MIVSIFNPYFLPIGSYMCENRDGLGDCSTICLPSSSYDHTCHCPDGEEILNDKKTCANGIDFKCCDLHTFTCSKIFLNIIERYK